MSKYLGGLLCPMELHKECDWIMKNYDLRKSARAGEVDSLKNAKAVLSGADYGL